MSTSSAFNGKSADDWHAIEQDQDRLLLLRMVRNNSRSIYASGRGIAVIRNLAAKCSLIKTLTDSPLIYAHRP